MKVLIRVDSSTDMGTGHVMRCLTLAHALQAIDAQIVFVCRETVGNIVKLIEASGYPVELLKAVEGPAAGSSPPQASPWLAVSQETDAQQCVPIFEAFGPAFTVVDHYGLDYRWHDRIKPYTGRVMVIDDLADREHHCDLLLDQTYGRAAEAYANLVSASTRLLVGSEYALLRPEFSALRESSLQRRVATTPRNILVSMGGTDGENYTGRILAALLPLPVPHSLNIHVIMGGQSPALQAIQHIVEEAGAGIRLSVDVSDMAQAMVEADLAIGAAGSTSWERCCLGLPTLMFVLADNQSAIASNLETSGAVQIVAEPGALGAILFGDKSLGKIDLLAMSEAAARITDGSGARTAVSEIAQL